MSYAAFRTSNVFYRRRPPANRPAARIAWDILTDDGRREIVSMRLLDGQWMCVLSDGDMDEVEAVWVTSQTPRVLRAIDDGVARIVKDGGPPQG